MSEPTDPSDGRTNDDAAPADAVIAAGLAVLTNEGKPAARVGDVTAQGDVVVSGEPTVLINGLPAARAGDVTARGDVIAAGDPTVLIGGRPAARLGDATTQGSAVATGSATVRIGASSWGQVIDPLTAPAPEPASPEEASALTDPASQLDPSEEARKHIDSTAWAFGADRPPYPSKTHKCNLFVYEILNASGKPVPMVKRERLPSIFSGLLKEEHPPLAGQWADPSFEIPGWEVVTDPRLGDVAAIAQESLNASGHVGIVSGPASTISAAKRKVVETDWGFQPGQQPTFRRYRGP